MRSSIVALGTGSVFALAILAACSSSKAKDDACVDLTLPGTVIFNPPIDLLVRDAIGRGQAIGDTAIVYRGQDSLIMSGRDTLHLLTGFTQPGTFTVRVKRPFYRDAVVQNVVVESGSCRGTLTTEVPVTLQLAPGAPAVRSLAVLGADFLYAPGVQRQLVARLDADPAAPTTVTWRLSDSTLVSIDGSGLVIAKCSVVGGAEKATAVANADTTVKGSATFSVVKAASCP